MSAGCDKPVTVEYVGRKDKFMMKYHDVTPEAHNPATWESVSVILSCKCRQCETCLKKRRQHWWFRAKAEMAFAPRTWFATLTYAPDQVYLRTILARRKCEGKGIDFDALSPDDQYPHLADECGKDLTLMMKRLRKNARGPLRYIFVGEAHKSGVPHFHALIHEVKENAATYDVLKRSWPHGHSAFKLADPKAVSYVAKYISKDARTRVRASEHYGKDTAYSLSGPENGSESGVSGGVRVRKESLGKEKASEEMKCSVSEPSTRS